MGRLDSRTDAEIAKACEEGDKAREMIEHYVFTLDDLEEQGRLGAWICRHVGEERKRRRTTSAGGSE